MRQLVRRVIDRKGRVRLIDLPEPHLSPDQLLIQNAYTVISSGTEVSTISKTAVELARQTLSDPWMRHVVMQTVFATGLAQTAGRIWKEMVIPREIGYTGAGTVLALGKNVEGPPVGTTVAYAAAGHAEIVAPGQNHVVPVPATVDPRHAAFVTLGGIAIQSLRRAELQFGETVAVYGLGLVGQLCAMIAKMAGCVVVGIDVNAQRNRIAQDSGADLTVDPSQTDLVRRIMDFTDKRGVDATIICARSKSDDIVNTSMELTRRQGRVVIVGYVGLNVHPKNFLYKEIDLRYSRAYGPGSYDNSYEKGRIDYPFGYVRWTEKRNLEEFVRILATKRVDVDPLIGGTYRLEEAQKAFDDLCAGQFAGVAALITYNDGDAPDRCRTLEIRPRPKQAGRIGVSIVGCGNHVLGKHLPHLRAQPGIELRGIVSATGKNASIAAERYGATINTTDIDAVLRDDGTDAVMICSAQHKHAEHLLRVIPTGKAVFVEKPMVTRLDDFCAVSRLMEESRVLFTLGLNRRYSSLIDKLRSLIEGPINAVEYVVAVPFIPPEHWTLDSVEGAGRLITEGEHFIDLCHLFIGRPPVSVSARALGKMPDDIRKLCNFAVTIGYEGAVANIVFNESGAKGYAREKITAFAHGQVAVLDDFIRLTIHGKKGRRTFGGGLQADMGHKQELAQFIAAINGEPNQMLTWKQASTATLCMFAAQESIRAGEPVLLHDFLREIAKAKPADQETS